MAAAAVAEEAASLAAAAFPELASEAAVGRGLAPRLTLIPLHPSLHPVGCWAEAGEMAVAAKEGTAERVVAETTAEGVMVGMSTAPLAAGQTAGAALAGCSVGSMAAAAQTAAATAGGAARMR